MRKIIIQLLQENDNYLQQLEELKAKNERLEDINNDLVKKNEKLSSLKVKGKQNEMIEENSRVDNNELKKLQSDRQIIIKQLNTVQKERDEVEKEFKEFKERIEDERTENYKMSIEKEKEIEELKKKRMKILKTN